MLLAARVSRRCQSVLLFPYLFAPASKRVGRRKRHCAAAQNRNIRSPSLQDCAVRSSGRRPGPESGHDGFVRPSALANMAAVS